MKDKILICNFASTGVNYLDDIRSRNYEPVILDVTYPGTEEEKEVWESINMSHTKLAQGVEVIPYNPDYEKTLEEVRKINPVAIVAGSEFGVDVANKLAADLGLVGNPKEIIPAMVQKDKMQLALKNYGIRYIKGAIVDSIEEAEKFYASLGSEMAVVKRARGAGTEGVTLCDNHDEFVTAVTRELGLHPTNGDEKVNILVQERIQGTEYIVNTVSCGGRHKLTSVWKYNKIRMSNGTNAYERIESVDKIGVGYSRLITYAYDVLDAIGIQNGPVHAEYIVDDKGPVLIEVNCRPMGGAMGKDFVEKIYGHHETDVILDAYLYPEKFDREFHKPYRTYTKGVLKIFILPEDTPAETAPILPISKNLRSYYGCIFERVGRDRILKRTNGLETSGGYVFLLNDDEKALNEDMELLHTMEMKMPRLLYNTVNIDSESSEEDNKPERNIQAIISELSCMGNTLVLSDKVEELSSDESLKGVTIINRTEIKDAYDSYEQAILDLSEIKSFADTEILFRELFKFFGKVRVGGRIIVPESTYCNIPYGIDGMEAILRCSGLRIEVPEYNHGRVLVASV